ncbi:MAG: tetratricopeptide repeat protein [Limisphaerales bacterium]
MRHLEPPDVHFLSAAMGWIELGLPHEAHAELARISRPARDHAEVLGVEWDLCEREGRWNDALQIADRILESDPERATGWINRSFALHVLGRTAEARTALRPAIDLFPSNGLIPYNLACYACQLNRLQEARQWLRKAMALDGRDIVLARARTDVDLTCLIPELDTL